MAERGYYSVEAHGMILRNTLHPRIETKLREYVLRPFTPERLTEVEAAWKSAAGEEEFSVELANLFEWCKTHMEPVDNAGHALELVHSESGDTHAILDMIQGKWATLSKLLKLYIAPEFWDATEDEERRKRAARVHSAAFATAVVDGMTGTADTVKVYGRTPEMLETLRRVQENWTIVEASGVKWSATFEGRWLTIVNNERR